MKQPPKIGARMTLDTVDDTPPVEVEIVGQLTGKGPEGRHGVIAVIVEDAERRDGRITLDWPLVKQSTGERIDT